MKVISPVEIPAESLEEGNAKKGVCPSTIKVGGETASIVTVCDSYQTKDDPNTYEWTIYSKIETEEGVSTVTKAMATEMCEQMIKNATEDGE